MPRSIGRPHNVTTQTSSIAKDMWQAGVLTDAELETIISRDAAFRSRTQQNLAVISFLSLDIIEARHLSIMNPFCVAWLLRARRPVTWHTRDTRASRGGKKTRKCCVCVQPFSQHDNTCVKLVTTHTVENGGAQASWGVSFSRCTVYA